MVVSAGKGKYVIISHKTGKRLSKPASLTATKKRLREIQFFKHKGK